MEEAALPEVAPELIVSGGPEPVNGSYRRADGLLAGRAHWLGPLGHTVAWAGDQWEIRDPTGLVLCHRPASGPGLHRGGWLSGQAEGPVLSEPEAAGSQWLAGGCHCRAVRFEMRWPRGEPLVAWECNCSICAVKRNTHVVVPEASFALLTGADRLTTYRFGSHTAQHLFCEICGVVPFYRPRSNPDGMACTLWCLDDRAAVEAAQVRQFDGQNWDEQIQTSEITGFSKLE